SSGAASSANKRNAGATESEPLLIAGAGHERRDRDPPVPLASVWTEGHGGFWCGCGSDVRTTVPFGACGTLCAAARARSRIRTSVRRGFSPAGRRSLRRSFLLVL